MEDQQRDSGELTAEGGDLPAAEPQPSPHLEDQGDDPEASTGRRFRRFGGWPAVAAVAAAALFVGATVFAAIAVQPHLADRADTANRVEVARTAAAAVTTLWTYTPETIDTLADRADDYLTADFGAQYRRFLDSVALANKRAQMTDDTDVVGVAVQSLTNSDAAALVFTNTTAKSPLTQNIPSLKYVAYRLELKHEGSRWKVRNMATISFIDLTPKL